jgi:phenylalanyl-tRNA synthetase beta subunit
LPNIIPISELPSSFKDISYSIKDYNKTEELQDLLLNYQSDIVKNIYIFDYFKNEKQKEIKIGFRFIFQSKKTTLNSAEMESVYNDIVNNSLKISGISIPGI